LNFERHLPQPALAGLVDYLWHVSDAPAHARERILPNGTQELVFNLEEDEVRIYDGLTAQPCRRLSGSVVSGVFSRFFVIDTREHACMLGVHFKPGGAFPFLRGLPAHELADSHLDLATLWGSRAPLLRERLASASSIRQRFQLLEGALLDELRSVGPGHRAIPPAIHALDSNATPITALAAQANLSHRRLIELFNLEVGATPKLFQRLRRFQRALELGRSTEGTRLVGAVGARSAWAHIAQYAGYYDQSHWIRDCVAFSGLTPAQYSSQWTGEVKEYHVPLVRAAEPERWAEVEG
jgi:AraC-like DNA-binding protein